MKKPILLIDIDEVLYPFTQVWYDWAEQHGKDLNAFKHLTTDYDVDQYIPYHLDELPLFLETYDPTKILPYDNAAEAVRTLSTQYEIIAVTARDKVNYEQPTQEWLKHHIPEIKEVIFTRTYFKGTPLPKAEVAAILSAEVLIDDTSTWVEGLPENVKGYVIERQAPLKSDNGAVSWQQILTELL